MQGPGCERSIAWGEKIACCWGLQLESSILFLVCRSLMNHIIFLYYITIYISIVVKYRMYIYIYMSCIYTQNFERTWFLSALSKHLSLQPKDFVTEPTHLMITGLMPAFPWSWHFALSHEQCKEFESLQSRFVTTKWFLAGNDCNLNKLGVMSGWSSHVWKMLFPKPAS